MRFHHACVAVSLAGTVAGFVPGLPRRSDGLRKISSVAHRTTTNDDVNELVVAEAIREHAFVDHNGIAEETEPAEATEDSEIEKEFEKDPQGLVDEHYMQIAIQMAQSSYVVFHSSKYL